MLKVTHLVHRYPDGRRFLTALSVPHLEAYDGEAWCITGPSGSGKSTFLHCLSGLLRPTEGDISYKGRSLTLDMSDADLDVFRGRTIGCLYQKFNLLPFLSCHRSVKGKLCYISHHLTDLAFLKNVQLTIFEFIFCTACSKCSKEYDLLRILCNINKSTGSSTSCSHLCGVDASVFPQFSNDSRYASTISVLTTLGAIVTMPLMVLVFQMVM